MSDRPLVAVLFGGRSGEHEVSLASAESVLSELRRSNRYQVLPVGIDRDGGWHAGDAALEVLAARAAFRLPGTATGETPADAVCEPVALFPGSETPIGTLGADGIRKPIKVDVVFPVLHGPYGEDGTVQGLLETIGLPYVGSGVCGSAVAMDKDLAKSVLRDAGLPVLDWVTVTAADWETARDVALDRAAEIGMPCFVKPANMGSSVGIRRVAEQASLESAIGHALAFDRKVLIEPAVDAREIEVAVLGNDAPRASVPGEIEPSGEFYDYDSKYIDGASKLNIPADLEAETALELRTMAVEAFIALEGSGMGRVDFLLERTNGTVVINEMNTIPGFTSISMYTKLWQESGIGYAALLDRLIDLALERFRTRQALALHAEAGGGLS